MVALIDKVAQNVHEHGVRGLFGPGRVWLFGTQHPFSTWLDHARGLARVWAAKAPEFASVLVDGGCGGAPLIEDIYTHVDVPGGVYVAKFMQGDLSEYGTHRQVSSESSRTDANSVIL